MPREWAETERRSPDAQMWAVRADDSDPRDWLRAAPLCPALARHRIRHAGVGYQPAPYEIVRTKLGGGYFLAGFAGEGRVLVDGRWARLRPGEAMLLPPGTRQAFHTARGQRWDHCWVRYEEGVPAPFAAAQTPVFAQFDAEPLRHALLGLHAEAAGPSGAAALGYWADIVQMYVLRFAQPASMDPRVAELWGRVAARLSHEWTLAELAKSVHLSEKQLQRLCLKNLGRSPRQHLIWLRMRRAAELLARGEAKVATVAGQVGYANPFVFSSTFKRIMGCTPSDYPSRRR